MTEGRRIPHSIYRLFGKDDEFLYVGCTKEPMVRLRTHANERPWWFEVEYALFEHFETKGEALAAELTYIRTFKPKYNFAPSQSRRPRDPHAAPVERAA